MLPLMPTFHKTHSLFEIINNLETSCTRNDVGGACLGEKEYGQCQYAKSIHICFYWDAKYAFLHTLANKGFNSENAVTIHPK